MKTISVKEKAPVKGREPVISVIAALLIPLPLMVTSVVSSFGALQLKGVLIFSGCGAAAWLLGQILGFLLKKSGKKIIYAVRIGFILAGIGLVAGYETLFSSLNEESLSLFIMPFALCFWYWFGYRTGAGQNPVSYAVLGIYCAEAAIMFPLCGAFEEDLHGGRNFILIVTAIMTVLGALIINGRQLDRISFRGKSDSGVLSSASKRFNTNTTLIFCLILLCLFFFAGYGAEMLWEGSKAILRFLLYLLSLLNKDNTEYEFKPDESGINEADPELQGDGIIGQIIICVILAAMLILLAKPFIKGVKALYRKIVKRLGRRVEEEEIPQYTDIYQVSDKSGFENNGNKGFKKAVKAFKKEKDTTKKYRAGYRAFMIYIGEKSEQASPSETVRVHLEKGRRFTKSPYLERAAEIYCRVRYDDYTASNEDIITIGNLLKELP